jgi:hypothetical protein
VDVHVDQARNQVSPGAIDDLGVLRDRDLVDRPDHRDAIAAYEHGRVWLEPLARIVPERHVADGEHVGARQRWPRHLPRRS